MSEAIYVRRYMEPHSQGKLRARVQDAADMRRKTSPLGKLNQRRVSTTLVGPKLFKRAALQGPYRGLSELPTDQAKALFEKTVANSPTESSKLTVATTDTQIEIIDRGVLFMYLLEDDRLLTERQQRYTSLARVPPSRVHSHARMLVATMHVSDPRREQFGTALEMMRPETVDLLGAVVLTATEESTYCAPPET